MEQPPECPFEILGDLVCAELIVDKIHIALSQNTKRDELGGRFMVIGVGPGIQRDSRDPNSELVKPNFKPGEWIMFQQQNAHMFQDSKRLPDRYFAMIRGGQILAKWNDTTPPLETVQKILSMG
jgi:hypothetical protein